MRKSGVLIMFILFVACNEPLIEKPENLISKDKMVEILKEMAIVNAAKNTNITKFQDNKIDPTAYVFKKFNIDSLQFVLSDKYYASKPDVYESIYEEIDTLLYIEKKVASELKKMQDSLKKAKKATSKNKPKKGTNSPPKK
ncbi:DUF4296 domain-containing protein [uncultured Maribacter sp.]|uniref:DUF4296 domain-containing protein n=1 Tax=uncultured Maribacter sp. TaxID=431308 RepID=UPI00262CCEA3|nr:DUF4296 domain-containing protein [uncultured Maribacter sp.]